MRRRVATWILVMAVGAGGLAGCCTCATESGKGMAARPLPPVISVAEQVRLLNERARAMPLLTAVTTLGGVTLNYMDEQGKSHEEHVDGRLWVRQHFGDATGADVVLYGRWSGSEVFQAGKNAEKWWFILRTHGDQAWVGDVRGAGAEQPAMTDPAFDDAMGNAEGDSAGESILRADRVLDVLAITEILPKPGQVVAMRVSDAERANIVMIERLRPDGTAWVRREITVDRDTGDVRGVQVFDPRGELVVAATLDVYRPVTFTGAKPEGVGPGQPRMPHRVRVSYPAAQASLELTFDEVSVPSQVNGEIFETPDWDDLGIKPTVVR